jgi:hypothetical protein
MADTVRAPEERRDFPDPDPEPLTGRRKGPDDIDPAGRSDRESGEPVQLDDDEIDDDFDDDDDFDEEDEDPEVPA